LYLIVIDQPRSTEQGVTAVGRIEEFVNNVLSKAVRTSLRAVPGNVIDITINLKHIERKFEEDQRSHTRNDPG